MKKIEITIGMTVMTESEILTVHHIIRDIVKDLTPRNYKVTTTEVLTSKETEIKNED